MTRAVFKILFIFFLCGSSAFSDDIFTHDGQNNDNYAHMAIVNGLPVSIYAQLYDNGRCGPVGDRADRYQSAHPTSWRSETASLPDGIFYNSLNGFNASLGQGGTGLGPGGVYYFLLDGQNGSGCYAYDSEFVLATVPKAFAPNDGTALKDRSMSSAQILHLISSDGSQASNFVENVATNVGCDAHHTGGGPFGVGSYVACTGLYVNKTYLRNNLNYHYKHKQSAHSNSNCFDSDTRESDCHVKDPHYDEVLCHADGSQDNGYFVVVVSDTMLHGDVGTAPSGGVGSNFQFFNGTMPADSGSDIVKQVCNCATEHLNLFQHQQGSQTPTDSNSEANGFLDCLYDTNVYTNKKGL